MKRVIFSTLFFLSAVSFATAQSGTANTSSNSRSVGTTSKKAKSKKAKKPSEELNNRKIYHFKNGQRSTPTGNEAAAVGGGYAALGRNRATEETSDTVAGRKAILPSNRKAASKTKKRNR